LKFVLIRACEMTKTRTSKLPWSYEVKRIQNGYEYQITDADGYTVGVLYGSTNAMWDFVPGANEALENVKMIVNAVNEE
jgi:hypothetical protein